MFYAMGKSATIYSKFNINFHCYFTSIFQAVTESLVIHFGMIFLFTHISYVLKWIIALSVIIFYIIIVFAVFDFLFEYSVSSNPYFFPEFAHVMVLCRTAWVFHIMNREIEFISRMDFK